MKSTVTLTVLPAGLPLSVCHSCPLSQRVQRGDSPMKPLASLHAETESGEKGGREGGMWGGVRRVGRRESEWGGGRESGEESRENRGRVGRRERGRERVRRNEEGGEGREC